MSRGEGVLFCAGEGEAEEKAALGPPFRGDASGQSLLHIHGDGAVGQNKGGDAHAAVGPDGVVKLGVAVPDAEIDLQIGQVAADVHKVEIDALGREDVHGVQGVLAGVGPNDLQLAHSDDLQ